MNLEHLFFELAPAIVNLFQYESEATEYIEKICLAYNPNREVLSSFDDKLRLAAKRLPPIFSEGTKYSCIPH